MERVLGADPADVVQADLASRIEIHVRSEGVIEILEIPEEGRPGPHVLQVQGLAPSHVGADHVGLETLLLQGLGGARHLLAVQHTLFEIPQVPVRG